MEFILTSLIFFGFSSFYISFSFLLILLLEGINKLLFNKERCFQEDYSLFIIVLLIMMCEYFHLIVKNKQKQSNLCLLLNPLNIKYFFPSN